MKRSLYRPCLAAFVFAFSALVLTRASLPGGAGAAAVGGKQKASGRETPTPTPGAAPTPKQHPKPPRSLCGANPPTRGTGNVQSVDIGGGVKLEMIEVPPGSFCMGARNGSPDERPVRKVEIGYSFFMGKYEVTQAQWRTLMGNNPSFEKGDDLPVGNVTWNDAAEFCRKLSRATGREYRLPTEAEWEYACRAGTTGDFAGDPGEMGWYENTGMIQPVGRKRPNSFGLYDMHGNVWEWCQDYYHKNYKGAPTDGSAWVSGESSEIRVQRGGSVVSRIKHSRSAYRDKENVSRRLFHNGFRIVMVPRA